LTDLLLLLLLLLLPFNCCCYPIANSASMGGMVAQELALLLLPQHRLLSLALSITCRGMKPMYGLLGPIFAPKVIIFIQLRGYTCTPGYCIVLYCAGTSVVTALLQPHSKRTRLCQHAASAIPDLPCLLVLH
jgi:hypothetical protein